MQRTFWLGGSIFSQKGKKLTTSPQQMVSIAFAPGRSREVGGIFKASRKTIQRIRCAVAHISLRVQSMLLRRGEAFFEAQSLDWACCHLMWDETSEKLALDALGQILACSDAGSSAVSIAVGVADADA